MFVRPNLQVIAKGTSFPIRAPRPWHASLRRTVPVQRHAKRRIHLCRRAFSNDAPATCVLLHYPQTPPGEIFRNRIDFFLSGAMPLEELSWRKVNALFGWRILPVLKIGHLGTPRLLPDNYSDR